MVGVAAQTAFTVGWVITETWQGHNYNPINDTISDMQAANAPHVWFPIVCFALGSTGTFTFVVFGLRPALSKAGKVAAFAPWTLAIAGLAIGNSFPLIPCQIAPSCSASHQLNSPGGITDAVVATIAFLVLALTPVPLWRRLRVLPEWRHLKPVMLAASVLGPVSFVLLGVASSTNVAEGLAERTLTTVCVLWIAALALTLVSNARRARSPSRAP
ncbi:MAG: DUF998 domain-containing protein [Candidatus Dormiibacterota bacterium]